ncbi:SgcJ/EcaC family oxidoreductase [Pseudoneobacillus sp. C159]
MESLAVQQVQSLYYQTMEAWNNRDAHTIAHLYTVDGESIGFDGIQIIGRESLLARFHTIFEETLTSNFVYKIKDIHFLSPTIAIIRAIAGMVPPGHEDIIPNGNTHHTLIIINQEGKWLIKLFQSTPARFLGRPDLCEQMTEELRELL